MGELLGLENCPAILPTLTTGKDAEKVKTKAICKITLKVSLILSGWNSAKLSAQSPPCKRKAFHSVTWASDFINALVYPAKTRGGYEPTFFKTIASSFSSSYFGMCLTG